MEESSVKKKRELVTLLKNGFMILKRSRSNDRLAIYAQNLFTSQIFLIEKSFKVNKNKTVDIGAVLSRDGKVIKIFVSELSDANPVLYTVSVENNDVVAPVHKDTIPRDVWKYGASGYGLLPVDNVSGGGVFHSDIKTYLHLAHPRGTIDLTSRVIKEPDVLVNKGSAGFAEVVLHTFPDGVIGLSLHKQNPGFLDKLLGSSYRQSYFRLYDTATFNLLTEFQIFDSRIHCFALSSDRKLLAISYAQSHPFVQYGRGESELTKPIIVSRLDREKNEKLIEFNLASECLPKPRYYEERDRMGGNLLCMAISHKGKGTLAVAFKHPDGYLYLYFRSINQYETQHMPLNKIRLSVTEREPSVHFLGDDDECFLFSISPFCYLFKRDAVTDEWALVKQLDFTAKKAIKTLLPVEKPLPSAPPPGTQTLQNLRLPRLPEGASAPPMGEVTQQMLREKSKPRQVNIDEIKQDRMIGRGGMGVVHHGFWRQREIAIKTLLTPFESTIQESRSQMSVLQKECDVLGSICHPNIVDVLGYSVQKDGSFCLLMEYYPNGSLSHYIYSPAIWNNPIECRLRWLQEVSEGLAYLHRRDLLHLDIKPENIFLSANWRAVIGDFGISRQLQTNHTHLTTNVVSGTISFSAPELLAGDSRYNKPNDIYSASMLAYVCMAERMPYQGKNVVGIITDVVMQKREPIPKETPPKLAALISRGWLHDAAQRPTAEQFCRELNQIYSEEMKGKQVISIPSRK